MLHRGRGRYILRCTGENIGKVSGKGAQQTAVPGSGASRFGGGGGEKRLVLYRHLQTASNSEGKGQTTKRDYTQVMLVTCLPIYRHDITVASATPRNGNKRMIFPLPFSNLSEKSANPRTEQVLLLRIFPVSVLDNDAQTAAAVAARKEATPRVLLVNDGQTRQCSISL